MLRTFWVVIHCPLSPLYCEITELFKSGAREKQLHSLSMHDIDIPAQNQHAHNGAPCSPIERRCHFFPSTLLKKKNDVLIIKNSKKLQRKTTQYVREKIWMHYILKERFWLNISRVISKSVRRELTFLVECICTVCLITLNNDA